MPEQIELFSPEALSTLDGDKVDNDRKTKAKRPPRAWGETVNANRKVKDNRRAMNEETSVSPSTP
jgi:hypothetical protein